MFEPSKIIGIDKLRTLLPDKLQYWYLWSDILEMRYSSDIDDYGNDIKNLELVLAEPKKEYKIRLHLLNVHGKVDFNTYNGFYSGMTIEDLSDSGCEKENRFHLYSLEMDAKPDLYCESLSVELL
ncbi:MAG: hypothetical protein IJS85_02630 [Clostridiales bacterium]|nr:hypothetical protein [Clostridiales bacterium]